MTTLSKAYPDDVEARAFLGLGLAAITIGLQPNRRPSKAAQIPTRTW